jgi:CTP synthase
MQMAVIEYSRNVLGYADANSTEMNDTQNIRLLMEEQRTSLKRVGQCVLELGNVILKQIH